MTGTDRPDPDDYPDVDPWVIPLNGTPNPAGSADAGAAPPVFGVLGPGADTGPTLYPADDDQELPTEGFHPRLRRSA